MKGVNLIPQRLRAARAHKRRRRRWALGCAAYAASLMMTCAVMHGMWSSNCRSLDNDIATAAHRIEDDNRTINGLRSQLGEMQEKSRVSDAIADQADWSILLSAIGSQVDEDLVLREVRLGPNASVNRITDVLNGPRRFQLAMRGASRNSAAVSRFVSKLEQMQFFDDVKLLRTSRENFLNGPAIGFEVETTFGSQQRRPK